MVKNVVVTGYNGSGASALKDLLMEYDNCCTVPRKSYEHVLFYTPNGLFDLEDKLLLRNNQVRSDEALKSFKKEMYKLWKNDFQWCGGYKELFNNEFKEIYEQFINELRQFTLKGYWSYDFIELQYSIRKIFKDTIKRVFGKKVDNFGKTILKYEDNEINISFVSEKEFYDYARKFVSSYLNMFNKKNNMYIYDHLLKPSHVNDIDNYFTDDFRMIIVERDVRSLFLYNKYIRLKDYGINSKYPTDVNEFVEFWKRFKSLEKNCKNNKKVLRIYLEDLVYNYDNTVKKIEEFLELDSNSHSNKGKYFNIDRAEKKSKLYLQNDEWKNEISIIEKELKEYLYK